MSRYNPLDHVGSDENVISMEDVRKAIAALEREREWLEDAITDAETPEGKQVAESELSEWVANEDKGVLLAKLIDLENEVDRRSADYLVNEDHFEDYAKQLADDLHGTQVTEAKWPFDCIDWEEAAEKLKQEYTQVEYDGVTFYHHS